MKRRLAALWLGLAVAVFAVAPLRGAQDIELEPGLVPGPKPLVYEDFSYGPDKRDRALVVVSRSRERGPLVVELAPYAGLQPTRRYGLDWVPAFLFDNGFVHAVVRPVQRRSASGTEHARSMALAVAEIARRGEQLGYDGSRIILMGQASGGHMAALLATDLSYLAEAGVPASSVRGALILDGSGLDLASEVSSASALERRSFERLLGKAEGAEAAMSPLTQAASPNAPRFLFHAVKDDPRRVGQARVLAAALTAAGAWTEVRLVGRTPWRAYKTYLGYPTNPDNEPLLRFLQAAAR